MRYTTIFLLAAILISSCNIVDSRRVKGNGKISSKTYDLKNFKSIDAGGAMHIFLRQDSVFSVKVETDENLLEYVRIEKDGNTLEINNRNNFNLRPTDEVKIYVGMPRLSSIDISGASTLTSEEKFIQDSEINIEASGASEGEINLRAPRLIVTASGASTLNISGETRDLKAEANGASTIKAFDLKSENAEVQATGASTVQSFASISLNAGASGASTVHYRGNPKITSDASGASSINKAD